MTRRRLLAAATAVLMLAAIILGAISSLSPAGAASSSDSLSPKAAESLSGSIVVIGTAGLSWSDVTATSTPALWSMLRDGATAALSVRSVHANTCPVDGWLSLSAGERAGDADAVAVGRGSSSAGTAGVGAAGVGPAGGGPDGTRPPCQALPDRLTAGMVPHWGDYLAAAAATSFGASPGLLGDQVARRGGCIQAVGPGAALGAARSNGTVDRYQPYDGATLTAAVASCPATLIDVGLIRDPADVDPRDAAQPSTSRALQVAAVDARVAAVLNAVPAGADVILASLADAGVTARLRVIAASGPRFGAGTLQSTSTGQLGLVQLADVAPTILEHLDIPRPRVLGGAPLSFVPGEGSSEQAASDRRRALRDDDEASHRVHSLVEPFFYGWALLQLALYLSAAVLWRRGWGTLPRRRSATMPRHGLEPRSRHSSVILAHRKLLLKVPRQVAVVAGAVPVSTFLANLLPWWRFPWPLVSIVACVGVFAAAISALALLGPWRRRLFGPLAVVCIATIVVLGADVMTGSRLQLSSLMGLQPTAGGRFYGMGNVTFALFATATLMLCIAVGNHLVFVGQPRMAAAAVVFIGLAAVMVDAAPRWGSDFGGPPALLPALALLILAILRIRVTWRRLLVIGGGTAVFVFGLGLLDWLRPAESRSHLGRFVQTAVDGGAGDIIARKLDQNISLLLGNALAPLIPVGLVLIAYALARPSSRFARPLRRSFERVPLLRPGLLAVLVMWLIGFVLNDSGTAIPAAGATVALPLLLSVALKTLEDETLAAGGTTRAARLQR